MKIFYDMDFVCLPISVLNLKCLNQNALFMAEQNGFEFKWLSFFSNVKYLLLHFLVIFFIHYHKMKNKKRLFQDIEMAKEEEKEENCTKENSGFYSVHKFHPELLAKLTWFRYHFLGGKKCISKRVYYQRVANG